jgi:hypothetical protein
VQQIGPEFRFCNEKEAGLNSFHHVSKDERVIQGKENNHVRFRNLFSCRLLTCAGHRRQKQEVIGKRRFDLFDERTRSENLPHRSGMDPDGPLLGEIRETSNGASTADLPVDAFAEFMERVQRFWAEQGISLPTSDEGTWR